MGNIIISLILWPRPLLPFGFSIIFFKARSESNLPHPVPLASISCHWVDVIFTLSWHHETDLSCFKPLIHFKGVACKYYKTNVISGQLPKTSCLLRIMQARTQQFIKTPPQGALLLKNMPISRKLLWVYVISLCVLTV